MMMIMKLMTMTMIHLKDLNGDPPLHCHQQLWKFPILKIEFLWARLILMMITIMTMITVFILFD